MTMALTPGRRTLLLFGTPVSILFIGYGGLAIINAIALTHYSQSYTEVPQVQELTVKASVGGVHLEPSSDGKVHLTVKGLYSLNKPKIKVVSTPRGLTITGSCSSFAVIACTENIVVQVPAAFAITASSSGGDVRATGLTGTLHLSSSAGDVRDDGGTGDLTMISTAGDVSGTNLRSATVSASSSAGDVDLSFASAPTKVEAGSSAGDVDIRVPDVGYNVTAESSGGDTHTRIKTDPSSPRSIDAHSSAGDVTVRPS
jgi:Putative adhesin